MPFLSIMRPVRAWVVGSGLHRMADTAGKVHRKWKIFTRLIFTQIVVLVISRILIYVVHKARRKNTHVH